MNCTRPNAAVDRRGQRLGQAGLADAGHVLDEQVALGDEAEQDELDDLGLALDDVLDVGDDVGVVVGEGRAAGGGLLPGGHRAQGSRAPGEGAAADEWRRE